MSEELSTNSHDQVLDPQQAYLEEQKKKEKKAEKKAKKLEEEGIKADRTFLAFERTLLSWVRTGVSLLTFGFAIIKLLEEKAAEPGDHPILRVVTPRSIGLLMIGSGFLCLGMAMGNYIKFSKKFNRTSKETFFNPAMIQAYVIFLLCGLILFAALVLGK